MNKEPEIKGRLDHIGKTPLEHFQDIKELEVADEQGLTVEKLLPYKCKQVEKSLKALEIIKEKPVESGDCINYITINKNNPAMLDYEHYCMTIKDTLQEEEFDLLKEVLE